MKSVILTTQSKGQLTLPKEWRDEFQTTIFRAIKEKNMVILEPIDVASDAAVMKTANQVIKKNLSLLKSLAKK